MNKSLRALLCIVLIFALFASGIQVFRYFRADRQVKDLRLELEESRSVWEGIAEKKESLQAELKQVTNDLKEARLSLSEAETRSQELLQEIDGLEKSIAEAEEALRFLSGKE